MDALFAFNKSAYKTVTSHIVLYHEEPSPPYKNLINKSINLLPNNYKNNINNYYYFKIFFGFFDRVPFIGDMWNGKGKWAYNNNLINNNNSSDNNNNSSDNNNINNNLNNNNNNSLISYNIPGFAKEIGKPLPLDVHGNYILFDEIRISEIIKEGQLLLLNNSKNNNNNNNSSSDNNNNNNNNLNNKPILTPSVLQYYIITGAVKSHRGGRVLFDIKTLNTSLFLGGLTGAAFLNIINNLNYFNYFNNNNNNNNNNNKWMKKIKQKRPFLKLGVSFCVGVGASIIIKTVMRSLGLGFLDAEYNFRKSINIINCNNCIREIINYHEAQVREMEDNNNNNNLNNNNNNKSGNIMPELPPEIKKFMDNNTLAYIEVLHMNIRELKKRERELNNNNNNLINNNLINNNNNNNNNKCNNCCCDLHSAEVLESFIARA